MDDAGFEQLVSRLEESAQARPAWYLATAVAVVLLGFVILAVAMLFALVPAVLFLALLLLLATHGAGVLLLLFKLGKLIALLIVPVWAMLKSAAQMLFTRFPRPEGRELTAQEAPALFAQLAALRQTLRAPRIHHVLLTDELNAAIVQYPRFGLFGFEQNYLILGLPLLQVVNEAEALAIVAHEFGHLSGQHGRFNGYIYRLRSTWGRIQQLSEQWQGWIARRIAGLFRWYAPYFNAYTFVLARQNEYAADRMSVRLVGEQSAANALLRVNFAAQFEEEVFWPAIQKRVQASEQPLANRSQLWQQSVAAQLDETHRLRYLAHAQQQKTDHLDTHPSLSDRLRAITMPLDEDAARALLPPTASAAEHWLAPSLTLLQQEFDSRWQTDVREQWQTRYLELHASQERLAALQTQATLTADERWQFVLDTLALEPDSEVLPWLEEILTADPTHIPARYQRGAVLLERGEEAGIRDLETAMSQTPALTLSGCELAWQFFRERDPTQAAQYRVRWEARANYEQNVDLEFQSLPVDATLEASDLSAETEAEIRQILQAHGKGIRRAYLLRRILKTDASLHDYVLAFETGWFTLGSPAPAIIQRLAQQTFPLPMFVVHLGGDTYKVFRKSIQQLKIFPCFDAKKGERPPYRAA